jgi:hypothetical protein
MRCRGAIHCAQVASRSIAPNRHQPKRKGTGEARKPRRNRRGGSGVEMGGDPCGRPRCLGSLMQTPRSSLPRATTRVPTPSNTSPAPTKTATKCIVSPPMVLFPPPEVDAYWSLSMHPVAMHCTPTSPQWVVQETLSRAHCLHPGGDALSHAVLWPVRVLQRRQGQRRACCRTALHTYPHRPGRFRARCRHCHQSQ